MKEIKPKVTSVPKVVKPKKEEPKPVKQEPIRRVIVDAAYQEA